MNEYEIREIDIGDGRSRLAMSSLVNEVFDLDTDTEKIPLNTYTRNGRTVYLGAFQGDELAAMNIFIAHELQYNNRTVIGYQSCWTATSKNHRKKGLFTTLINEAKKRLDGAFILGFPNSNSEPIFLKKLGFRRVGLKKLNIPVKFLPRLALKYYLRSVPVDYRFPVNDCFLTIEGELVDLKKGEYGEEIKVFGSYNNIIWGRLIERQTRLGKMRFFNVGGIQVNKPHLLPLVFQDIVKKERIDLIQLVACGNSSIWELFRGVSDAPRTEPLIIYDLDMDTSSSRFNFMAGLKDVF